MSVFSSASVRRSILATSAAAGFVLFAVPGLAQSFSPSVNGHYDIAIPSNPTSDAATRPLRTAQTRTFSPSVNGQVSVTIPVDRPADDVRLAARSPE